MISSNLDIFSHLTTKKGDPRSLISWVLSFSGWCYFVIEPKASFSFASCSVDSELRMTFGCSGLSSLNDLVNGNVCGEDCKG